MSSFLSVSYGLIMCYFQMEIVVAWRLECVFMCFRCCVFLRIDYHKTEWWKGDQRWRIGCFLDSQRTVRHTQAVELPECPRRTQSDNGIYRRAPPRVILERTDVGSSKILWVGIVLHVVWLHKPQVDSCVELFDSWSSWV